MTRNDWHKRFCTKAELLSELEETGKIEILVRTSIVLKTSFRNKRTDKFITATLLYFLQRELAVLPGEPCVSETKYSFTDLRTFIKKV